MMSFWIPRQATGLHQRIWRLTPCISHHACATLSVPLQDVCGGTVAGAPFTRQGSQVQTLYRPPAFINEIKALRETVKAFFFSVGKIWEKLS
jgi:hypothetical protein